MASNSAPVITTLVTCAAAATNVRDELSLVDGKPSVHKVISTPGGGPLDAPSRRLEITATQKDWGFEARHQEAFNSQQHAEVTQEFAGARRLNITIDENNGVMYQAEAYNWVQALGKGFGDLFSHRAVVLGIGFLAGAVSFWGITNQLTASQEEEEQASY